MIDLKIHHVGYLVKKMNRALEGFELLGYQKITDIVFDGYRMIDICFIEKNGYVIELISPKDKDSIVAGLMKKLGNNPYHICYCCENIEDTEKKLRAGGYIAWEDAHEAIALGGKKVKFLVHPFIGIIELLEL